MNKAITPKTQKFQTKWNSGIKNRIELPCASTVGNSIQYQLSLPPGSAVTGPKLSNNNPFQQAYFITRASGGKAKQFFSREEIRADFITRASGGKAKQTVYNPRHTGDFITRASGGKAKLLRSD